MRPTDIGGNSFACKWVGINSYRLIKAMNKSLGLMTTGMGANKNKLGISGGTQLVITYSPTITMPNGTTKEEFSQLLKKHKDEVVAIFRRELERKERVAY